MACATTAAERGHAVTLFDAAGEIGGQFNLARRIPGKEEFAETLRYFHVRLAQLGVKVELNQRPDAADLRGFDEVVLATGIVPRTPSIPGIDHPKVASYTEIVDGSKTAGQRVALIGAGGIGFDVAELLTAVDPPDGHMCDGRATDPAVVAFTAEWGIDIGYRQRGGLSAAHDPPPARKLWLLQRKDEKVGAGTRQDHRLDSPHAAQEAWRRA